MSKQSVRSTTSSTDVHTASCSNCRRRSKEIRSLTEMRGLARSGQLVYVPISLEEVPRLLTSGRLPINVLLLRVSPPYARGFVSLGVLVDLAPAILSVARRVIAEVNPAMPRTYGHSFVHLDRFDALVKVDAPVAGYLHPKIGVIAEHVTGMLRLAARAQGTVTTSRDVNAVRVTVLFPDMGSTIANC